ncbi:MAG: hypothetical protein ACREJ4_01905 [Candidatus Methylomirabilaceae bacterium]
MPDARAVGLDLPDSLPSWLAAFIHEPQRETDMLRDNGAEQAAAARVALLRKLIAAVAAHFDDEIDIHEAAREKGVCEETIRRAVRDGGMPDRRANPKGRHRVRRGDLDRANALGRPQSFATKCELGERRDREGLTTQLTTQLDTECKGRKSPTAEAAVRLDR